MEIGEVPYEAWHEKAELGFKKAACLGYEGSEQLDPNTGGLGFGSHCHT